MKINPGNARGLLVPQGDRPFSFVVYSSEIRDFGFDAVDKIGNRIARRNGNQEVDVINLSGKIENPNLKSIQNAV